MNARIGAIIVVAAALGLAAGGRACGVNGLADVRIIDRDSGVELTPHCYRGELWVAGMPGRRYAIEIGNRIGERVLAVASVDGVNAVSGATAGWDQVGYVLAAWQRYRITGWRKSDAEVAAFTFADAGDSYAARTGRPANVGVIGVALFRERRAEPVQIEEFAGRDRAAAEASGTPSGVPSDAPQAPRSAAKLGTGHGEREYSHVDRTDFERLQREPNEVVRIHYDSLDHLLAMGIIRRYRPMPSAPDAFPATPSRDYVPDPPA